MYVCNAALLLLPAKRKEWQATLFLSFGMSFKNVDSIMPRSLTKPSTVDRHVVSHLKITATKQQQPRWIDNVFNINKKN